MSSPVVKKKQIRCLIDMHVSNITLPLQVIHLENGCEGFSPNLYIPAKSELTGSTDILT